MKIISKQYVHTMGGRKPVWETFKRLEKGTYKGRDKDPKTVAGAYELLISTSIHIGPCTRQSGQFNHRVRDSVRSNFMFLQNGGWGDHGGHGEY